MGRQCTDILKVRSSKAVERCCSCCLHSSQPSSGTTLFCAQLLRKEYASQGDSTHVALTCRLQRAGQGDQLSHQRRMATCRDGRTEQ